MKAEDLLRMDHRELRALLEGGHPIDPRALDDREYEGVSLGLPSPLVKLTWLTFRKTFHRDRATGALRGWNVRMQQHGLHGAREPMRDRQGKPRCFGFYEVVSGAGYRMPVRCQQGLMIDYGRGRNVSARPWKPGATAGEAPASLRDFPGRALLRGLDPSRRCRDPLVALEAGSVEQLLGWTYLDLGPFDLGTPSYFLLQRGGPLTECQG